MLTAAKKAREVVQEISGQDPQNVAACEKRATEWFVVVELIESKARISDNDVIGVYEIALDDTGEVIRFNRTSRYRRADATRDVA